MKRLLTAIAVLGFLCLPAWATTRYADDDGTVNTGTCTVTQTGVNACTITRAVSQMAGSDTLILADGTYDYQMLDTIPSGSAGSPTIVQAANALGAILLPTAPSNGYGVIYVNNRSYITYDGIQTDASNCIECSGLYLVGTSNHIIFKNGRLKNGNHQPNVSCQGASNGILDADTTSSNEYRNNEIDHNGVVSCTLPPGADGNPHGGGVYVNSANTVIDGNYIHDNARYCGQSNQNAGATGVIINANRCFNSTAGEQGFVVNFKSVKVTNNILSGNSGNGLYFQGDCSSGCEAYFNVIYSSSGYCIQTTGGTNTIKNNICLSNGSGAINSAGGTDTCSNNLNVTGCGSSQGSTNPFVNASTNPATADFHLTANDNNGVAITGVTTDYAGLSRANPPDRGAYEFVATGGAGVTIFVGSGVIR